MPEEKKDNPPEPLGAERNGEKQRCRVIRLGVVIGNDENIRGATEWIVARARELGGPFHLWRDRTSRDPLDSFRDYDITDGRRRARGNRRYRLNTGETGLGLDGLLRELQNCRGRIEELVIFHHGESVEEAVVAERVAMIFRAIQVPVCRVVWWACFASVQLDVERDGAVDFMMRSLGRQARCRPCGCRGPVELIWPTEGRSHLSGSSGRGVPQTGDGKVLRARWGYRHPDGTLRLEPPVGVSPHPPPEPDAREPDYGRPPERVNGTVLGVPVGRWVE